MTKSAASFLNVAKSMSGAFPLMPFVAVAVVVVDAALALDDDVVESVLDFFEPGFWADFLGGMAEIRSEKSEMGELLTGLWNVSGVREGVEV